MSVFTAESGQFRLDGQPIFIHAGEFHYFRTPVDQWRHRLEVLQSAGFNTVATYIPWLWHQLEEDQSDLDGRSHPMRDLAGFLDLAAEMGFYILPRPGPYIMAETINEGIPPWVFQNYPQAAVIDQLNQVQNLASYLHPDFLACVQKWYQAVFAVLSPRQVSRGGRILMIQLDNEMGMMQWVRNIFDTNPDTIARFAAFLRAAYGDGLRDRYPLDGEPLEDFLTGAIVRPEAEIAERVIADYRRFYREYLREYMAALWQMAAACGMDVPPVLNIHGFGNGGKTYPIGLSQLVSAMRLEGMISATDVYPLQIGDGTFHELLLVNEMTKALQNPAQPLFSIEFQSGGNQDFGTGQTALYDLHSRLCISSGMRAINHYSFFAGTNDPVLSPVRRHDWGPPVRVDGTLRRHYHRYPRLSRVLAAYGQDLVLAQPRTVTTVGFILDYFMTEVNNAYTQEATNTLTHQRETILFNMIAKGLAITHRPFDAVDLQSAALDPDKMPHCWVMLERACSREIQQKLVDYARRGGRLVLAGRICLEDFDGQPCPILKDALGIHEVRPEPQLARHDIRVFEQADVPVNYLETYTGDFDEVFAVTESGAVVGFRRSLGRGSVMMLGAALPASTPEDIAIFDQLAQAVGCPPLFEMPDWLDARISTGENGDFLFLNNYQDDPVETTIAYEGAPLLGGNPIILPARRGAILPLRWRAAEGVLVEYATSEIVSVTREAAGLVLQTDQPAFTAELTLTGYQCAGTELLSEGPRGTRVRLRAKDGRIVLHAGG